MLYALDYFFSFLHIGFTLFNLVGWIWRRTRRIHLITILLTAASWFILGIWYGWGYCFLTDWQWAIKEKLGERNLPSSFVKYFADKVTGSDISTSLIITSTLVGFLLATILSIYLNIRDHRMRKTPMR